MSTRDATADRELMDSYLKERFGINVKKKEWSCNSDGDVVAKLGMVRVTNADDSRGLFEGDEGQLTAQAVGAADYGNERVMIQFTPPGWDEEDGEEVMPFEDVEFV